MATRLVIRSKNQMQEIIDKIKASEAVEENSEYRRASWRISFSEPATVEIAGKDLSDDPIYITIRDISVKGLGFLSHQKFSVGQKIMISLDLEDKEIVIPATVEHATQTIGQYKVGVTFKLV